MTSHWQIYDPLQEALRRYRQRRFTDADIVGCTGLSLRSWREAIKLKAVRTIDEISGPGRGRVRVCDDVIFKRAAIIAALNSAGFSIRVSGQIAYFLHYHTLLYVLYVVCDPLTVLFEHTTSNDPATGLPPLRSHPLRDWFEPDCPAKREVADWLVEVFDARFVACIYGSAKTPVPVIFGDLRDDQTAFVAWHPLPERAQVIQRLVDEYPEWRNFMDFVTGWENPEHFSSELKELGYRWETLRPKARLRLVANKVAHGFISKTTINISLALRKALRRYLALEPAIAPP
jgi:hypothetical protein